MRGLPYAVKQALEKARDSALLAVEIYNKPAVRFKSAGYITLMVIAWTALFHAVFFRRKVKPYYRKKNRHFEEIDGDYKHWELDECLRQYFGDDTGNPVRRNLEFFIPLRNKIEHRSLPELDSTIFGECQAMLLNFDDMLQKEFGARYCLRESLSFALQMFPSSESLAEAIRRNRSAKAAAEFISEYRSALSADTWQSPQYAFKAFLIQVANHDSREALAVQFRSYDKLTDDEKTELAKVVALVKYKRPAVANADTLRASVVVRRVQEGLGDPKVTRKGAQVDRFNMSRHTHCWQHYKVRPPSRSSEPDKTNTRYCIYDRSHNDYSYTEAWVQFLIQELQKSETWADLEGQQTSAPSMPGWLTTKVNYEHAPR